MNAVVRILLVTLALGGCNADPVREQRIDSLGPEAANVKPGPLHRPGQPCLVCHGGKGPGDSVFSIAGTVYKFKDTKDPLPDALVHLVDSKSRHYETGTNCAGNFFIDPHDFSPAFPVWVSVEFGGIDVAMSTPMFRSGSCGDCHRDPPSVDSVGHLYFAPTNIPFPPSNCP